MKGKGEKGRAGIREKKKKGMGKRRRAGIQENKKKGKGRGGEGPE